MLGSKMRSEYLKVFEKYMIDIDRYIYVELDHFIFKPIFIIQSYIGV
jgi:hypothetical protein